MTNNIEFYPQNLPMNDPDIVAGQYIYDVPLETRNEDYMM